MKTKEEILSKITKISEGCLVQDYKQKCITPEQTIESMQEYAEQYHKEQMKTICTCGGFPTCICEHLKDK